MLGDVGRVEGAAGRGACMCVRTYSRMAGPSPSRRPRPRPRRRRRRRRRRRPASVAAYRRKPRAAGSMRGVGDVFRRGARPIAREQTAVCCGGGRASGPARCLQTSLAVGSVGASLSGRCASGLRKHPAAHPARGRRVDRSGAEPNSWRHVSSAGSCGGSVSPSEQSRRTATLRPHMQPWPAPLM